MTETIPGTVIGGLSAWTLPVGLATSGAGLSRYTARTGASLTDSRRHHGLIDRSAFGVLNQLDADRAFLADVIGFDHVGAGGG